MRRQRKKRTFLRKAATLDLRQAATYATKKGETGFAEKLTEAADALETHKPDKEKKK
jgi:hypothetical protein